MIVLWCGCICDATGALLQADRVVSAAQLGTGVYEVIMENSLGSLEGSPVAVPWYVENAAPPQSVPMVRFVVGTDANDGNRLVVRGFAGTPPVPSDGPFSLLVWRYAP